MANSGDFSNNLENYDGELQDATIGIKDMKKRQA